MGREYSGFGLTCSVTPEPGTDPPVKVVHSNPTTNQWFFFLLKLILHIPKFVESTTKGSILWFGRYPL
jgi:hypothetical protein